MEWVNTPQSPVVSTDGICIIVSCCSDDCFINCGDYMSCKIDV